MDETMARRVGRWLGIGLYLATGFKVRGVTGKYTLLEVLHQYARRGLLERPKMGFHLPLSAWLRGSLKKWAEDLLNEDSIRQEGLLVPDSIRLKWDEHSRGWRDRVDHLRHVLMFRSWLRHQKSELRPLQI